MEETATNIYMPSPLQGLIGPDFGQQANSSPAAPNKLNPNIIWITGEFFGVQRARDMLFQVSMGKVRPSMSIHKSALTEFGAEQANHVQRLRDPPQEIGLDGYRARRGSESSYARQFYLYSVPSDR